VHVEQVEEGKIYLNTEAFDSENAQDRIESYLLEAEYDLEVAPGEFVREENQYVQYRFGHVLNVEEVVD
jgi:hypothetical protein